MHEETRQFIAALHGENFDGLAEIRLIPNRQGRVLQHFYSSLTTMTADWSRIMRLNEGGYNVYLGVGTRIKNAVRGTKAEVSGVRAVFLDYDFRDCEPSGQEVIATVESIIGESSIIIHTGHGLHFYFLLETRYVFGNETNIFRFESVLREMARRTGADRAVADVARVMRVPGTMNMKDPQNPIPARLLKYRSDLCYKFADIERRFTAPFSAEKKKAKAILFVGHIPSIMPESFFKLLESKPGLRRIWSGEVNYKSRSEADMALACSALNCGLSAEETLVVLRNFKYGRGVDAKESYLRLTVAKAASYTNRTFENGKGGENIMSWKPQEVKNAITMKNGWRPAEITSAYEATAKKSGAPMSTVVFTTTDEKTEQVWDYFVHDNDVAQKRMLSLLTAVGLSEKDSVEMEELVGRKLRIKVNYDKFEGSLVCRVKGYAAIEKVQKP